MPILASSRSNAEKQEHSNTMAKRATKKPRSQAMTVGDTVALGDEIATGSLPIASSADDNQLHGLSGDGILQVVSGVSQLTDGSDLSGRIILRPPSLSVISSFPSLLLVNGAGEVLQLPAAQDGEAFTIVSRNGSWSLAKIPPTKCFASEDICGDCTSTHVAGFIEVTGENGEKTLCLTKIAFVDFVRDGIRFASSTSIGVVGDGSPSSPFSFIIKISATSGNILQVVGDGLLAIQTS